MSAQTEEAAVRPAAGDGKGGAPPPESPRGRPLPGVPYLLILPTAVLTVGVLGWTLVQNGLMSFQTLNPRQLIRHVTEWTGIDNYREQLTSSEFWHVAARSLVFTAVNVVLIMLLGCAIGLLLARLGSKLRLLLSAALVLAWAMPVVAATTVFQWLFDQRFGVVNYALDKLGWHSMHGYSWTSGQLSTFFVITVLIVWQSVPFVAVNLYAATTTIPRELYEAAALDGATAWRRFTSVTFPFLKPFFLATTFLEVIWIFKAFTQVFAVNEGGPDRLTETLPVYAFQEGMGSQHFGVGAAISILTIVMLLAMTAYYLRLVLKQEEDEL